MKKLITTFFLLAITVLVGHAQEATQEKQKPKAVYQVGAAKVVVWENKREDGITWLNFQVEKVYKKEDEWHTTNSFNANELLELRAALDKAIAEENVKVRKP
jgi:hypothetical protein